VAIFHQGDSAGNEKQFLWSRRNCVRRALTSSRIENSTQFSITAPMSRCPSSGDN
jgi:hypothetical protein